VQYSALTNLQYWCGTPIRFGGSSERFAAVALLGRQQLEDIVPVVYLLALGIEGIELCAAWARSLVLPE
jgi:hypothetical protein